MGGSKRAHGRMNMQKDMISSDGFYRNCLSALEVEMECVLWDEIKFENEMAFQPNTECRIAKHPRYMYDISKE